MSSAAAQVTDAVTRTHASAKDLAGINLHYLIPGLSVPCTIFIYEEDGFTEVLRAGEVLRLNTYFELTTEFLASGFILKKDLALWGRWKQNRHPIAGAQPVLAPPATLEVSGRGAPKVSSPEHTVKSREFVAYVLSRVTYDVATPQAEQAKAVAGEVLKRTAQNKLLEWYFKKPPEEEIFYHVARVSYLGLIWAGTLSPTWRVETLETFTLSAIVHELAGNVRDTAGKPTSLQALEIIQRDKHPLPKDALELIAHQTETYNGKGMRGLKGEQIHPAARLFSIVNTFDHLRLCNAGGSRRMRLDRARALLVKQAAEFDPVLLKSFLLFSDKIEVLE